MSYGKSPQEIQYQTREKFKEKAKRQIERTEIDECNKVDYVRVKMSSIYPEIRKGVKAGHKKILM